MTILAEAAAVRATGAAGASPARRERSRAVALWLWAVAALVLGMVVVGGATRLTGSGLSITEWKPLRGALPPLSQADWQAEFRNYQRIPQYRLVNAGMSLDDFKPLFWWEWAHRLLGRLIGVVFFVPLVVFVLQRRIPRRLVWPCVLIFALGGLQGAIGWWMVSSGVFTRDLIAVAPERLAIHLGLALLLYGACLWTGLEAWAGPAPARRPTARPLPWRPIILTMLAFLQCLLGALVAGNKAGLIDNDWPLMNARLVPDDYVRGGLWTTLAHSPAAVQFNHRLVAYALLASAFAYAWQARREGRPIARAAVVLAAVVALQALLGIAALVSGARLDLSLAHQLGAAAVLTTAVALTWLTSRSQVSGYQVAESQTHQGVHGQAARQLG